MGGFCPVLPFLSCVKQVSLWRKDSRKSSHPYETVTALIV